MCVKGVPGTRNYERLARLGPLRYHPVLDTSVSIRGEART